jgi:uncharacterized protein
MTSAEKNVEIMKEMYNAAIIRQDIPAALKALDEDLVIHQQESLPYGGRYEGHAGFQKLFQNQAEQWDGLHYAPQEFIGDGETVVVIGQLTGKSQKSGKNLDIAMYELWRMRNNKAIEGYSIVYDTAKMLEVLN